MASTLDPPPRKDGNKGRKQGIMTPSRTARKAAPRESNGSESDEENIIKSSSGSSDAKPGNNSLAGNTSEEKENQTQNNKDDDDDDDASSADNRNILKKLNAGAQDPLRNTKPTAVGRGKNIPYPILPESQMSVSRTVAAAAPAPANGRQTLKAIKAGAKRRYTASPEAEESDDDSSHKVSTRSRSGHSSMYQWDVDAPQIRPQDIGTRLTYHNSINSTIEREGKQEKVRFRRGDKIWILPDPSWLPEVSHEVAIADLADDEFWVAEVLDCCSLDQMDTTGENVGVLRIRWFYSGDHALDLKNLHEDYKKKLRKYRFDVDERIRSDHLDFVGIECFAGFADAIESYLNLTGLEVDDRDRLRHPSMRAKNKKFVMMTGWKMKDTVVREQNRQSQVTAASASTKRLRRAGPAEETQEKED